MSTRLTFEAPADLSVGRVTVQNELGLVKEWVATPGQKTLDVEDARPGVYAAKIAPVGQRPQSFVFEVKPGVENTVSAPLFSALVAGGNTAAFSGVEDPKSALNLLLRGAWKHTPETSSPSLETSKPTPPGETDLVRSKIWTFTRTEGGGHR